MPDKQWNDLQQIINGEMLDPLPVGVMGEEDFKTFGLPIMKELSFHAEAKCRRALAQIILRLFM